MLQPLTWRAVAGLPENPFCAKHDRFVRPVTVIDASGSQQLECPYCVDEELPMAAAAESKEPLVPLYPRQEWRPTITHYCPYRECVFHTQSGHEALSKHITTVHLSKYKSPTISTGSSTANEYCRVAQCLDKAEIFCENCEVQFCKGHVNHKGFCPMCANTDDMQERAMWGWT